MKLKIELQALHRQVFTSIIAKKLKSNAPGMLNKLKSANTKKESALFLLSAKQRKVDGKMTVCIPDRGRFEIEYCSLA